MTGLRARARKSGETVKLRLRARPPTYPNLPRGYTFLKSLDFTSADQWEVREGQIKSDSVMRAANVAWGQGPAGKSLRLSGGRAVSGGEVSGAEIRGNGAGGKHQLPTNRYTICRLRYDTITGGNFPAVWERKYTSPGNGELDHSELFGTAMHSNMHTSPYVTGTHRQAWRSGMPQRSAGSSPGSGPHTIETLMIPGLFMTWWDGLLLNVFSQDDFDANATPVPPTGTTFWAEQFCTSTSETELWQPIFSNQWKDSYGGGIPAGVFNWEFYIDEFSIYVP